MLDPAQSTPHFGSTRKRLKGIVGLSSAWRGNWATRARIATGLVLFTYALTHFLNIGLGLVSSEMMLRAQEWRQVVTRNILGEILLYGSLLVHAGLALTRIGRRNTLRMPIWEAVQIALGLLIPFLLIAHIVFTRVAHAEFQVNDRMDYLVMLIFGTPDGWWQSLLVLIVWVHGCAGLHFWLRAETWWRRAMPYLIAAFVLVPAFALAGFLTEGRRIATATTDALVAAQMRQTFNWPDQDSFLALIALDKTLTNIFWGCLLLTAATFVTRKYLFRRKSVRVHFSDGPEITSPKGLTLLEMSRANGVQHTSLCGGRGRCTTCRVVVEDGMEQLHPPNETELRSLQAVGAPAGTRLACQIRPEAPLKVYRVFRPDGRRNRAHASHGEERRMAILFLDIRGFTARTTGQLPYDVVFMLNRFFDAIVPSIKDAGGTVDKYLGDGLLAVFEKGDEATSAQSALTATGNIGKSLEVFNRTLAAEGTSAIRIGIGVHLGEVVMGEIGAAGEAPRTIIGESVNAASRLEAKTKDLAVEALVSEAVLRAADIALATSELVSLELRGVNEPVRSLALDHASKIVDYLTGSSQANNNIQQAQDT